MTADVLFLIALTVFGLGYAILHFVTVKTEALGAAVAIAAGVMSVEALISLIK